MSFCGSELASNTLEQGQQTRMASPTVKMQISWREKDEETPSITFIASPARSLLLDFSGTPHNFISPRRHSQGHLTQSRPQAIRFDIISFLPPEIAGEIFQLLSPMDLCSVCGVCRKWYSLAQLGRLTKIRRRYVRQCREQYSGNKENRKSLSPTPPQVHSFTLTRSHSYNPLNTVQPTTRSRTMYRTPSPTPLIEEVNELHLTDLEYTDIRRRLFPGQLPLQEPSNAETIGKRMNKWRLKRL